MNFLKNMKIERAAAPIPVPEPNPSGGKEAGTGPGGLARMTFDTFERAGRVFRVDSRFLGEVVYFASDAATAKRDGIETYYTGRELHLLVENRITGDDLKALHLAKRELTARITSIEDERHGT